MHEVGIAQNVVEVALRHAAAHGARQVHRLRLRVGEMAGVCADSLLFAWDVVARGTPAEGAALEVETVPAHWFCARCGAEVDAGGECPDCPGAGIRIQGGDELDLVSLEVS